MNMIPYEDFKKLEIKIGKIEAAERVEGSGKLLKLQVDLGDGTRQIIAGIGRFHAPEDIIGHEIVVLANLEQEFYGFLQLNIVYQLLDVGIQ